MNLLLLILFGLALVFAVVALLKHDFDALCLSVILTLAGLLFWLWRGPA